MNDPAFTIMKRNPSMHTTRRSASIRSRIGVLVAFALVVAACSSGGWQEMPKPPIEGRRFAGSACSDSSLIVWGGATVRRQTDPENPNLVTIATFADGALFDVSARQWRPLPPAPSTARWAPATAIVGNELVVWGGAGSVVSSDDPTDFDYPNDGAVLDLSTMVWTYLPGGPLQPRFGGVAVPLSDREVFVYGGQATPGTDTSTLNAAFLDVPTLQISEAQSPPIDGVVFADRGQLVAVASLGVYEYASSTDEWIATPIEVPTEMGAPIAVVPLEGGTRAVVVSTSGSWMYQTASGFVALGGSPTVGRDAQVRSSTSGATMWDPASRSAWILHDHTWEPLPTPRRLGNRKSAAVCQTSSTLIIWGGQDDRETVQLTRDDGLILRIDD